MSIEITSDGRGFHQYGGPLQTAYGHEVLVYESSAAEGPHVWLHASGSTHVEPSSRDPRYDDNMGGMQVYREGDVGLHMTPVQTRELIARLQAWLDDLPERGWDGHWLNYNGETEEENL